MSKLSKAHSSEDFPIRFAEIFNQRDLDLLVNGCAEDATWERAGLSEGIRKFAKPWLTFCWQLVCRFWSYRELTLPRGTAVVTFEWKIAGASDNIVAKGIAIDFLRRDPAGIWKQLLDQPFGTGTTT